MLNINKKILLVSANIFVVPYPVYPLGISYIATYLKPKMPDCEIMVFDFNMDNQEEFIKLLHEFQPDHIGVSMRNVDDVNSYFKQSFIPGYQEIVDISRKHSKAYITIGGAGFSIYPDVFFDLMKPDFAIIGEGEESYRQLIAKLDANEEIDNIEGLLFMKDGKLFKNDKRLYLNDLELNLDDDLIEFYWQNSGMLNIQTKRGCPYSCIFCSYPIIDGRKVRTLNPDKIVDSISKLYQEKGIDYYFFTDSIFNIHNKFNVQLAEKLIESKVKIKWGAYFSPYNLDWEFLSLLRKSGLEHIEFGTDSISEAQLKNYKKMFKVDDVLRVSDMCNKLDIYFAHFLILGGYGETDETIDETYENSKKIENSVFFPFVGMRIYPGTTLQNIAISEGVISADDDLLYPKFYLSKNFNIDTLKERAKATGKRWVFPDEDLTDGIIKFRKKNKKGPLWEYLSI